MALTAARRTRIYAALVRAYSKNEIPIPWLKSDFIDALDTYDAYLDTEQPSANTVLSTALPASTISDRRTIDIVHRMGRYLIAQPQYVPVLRDILREIESIT